MLYDFICPKCGEKLQVNVSSSEVKLLKPKCSNCGNDMRRNYKAIIQIGIGDSADEIHDTSYVKECLKTRPTGKSKVFY